MFAAEGDILVSRGHEVSRYTAHNDAVSDVGQLALAWATVWNDDHYRAARERLRTLRPDIVHVHNTLPLISPSIYYAAAAEGAAVVQTLHNYRFVCPSALLFRDGKPCEACVGRAVPSPAVRFGCYRGSRAASGAVATSLVLHRALGTYRKRIHRYIALTGFAKAKFVEGGLPEEKIVVKPNFIDESSAAGAGDGGYALFVGRLSEEKGVRELIAAWPHVGNRLPLRIAGDGPLMNLVKDAAGQMPAIEALGRLNPAEVRHQMRGATVLMVPSTWYEGFPMTIVEAFAAGTPVVASGHGAMAEIVDDGRTGLHFRPGDAEDLALKLEWVRDHPAELKRMRIAARLEYETKYTASRNYALLLDIYEQAIAVRDAGKS